MKTNTSNCERLAALHKSVKIIAAFLQLPAFIFACTPARESAHARSGRQIYIQWSKNPIRDSVDLFFFDTTGAQWLDAYQRVPLEEGNVVRGLSRGGAKRLVALSGLKRDWYQIRTYGDLCKTVFSLEDDTPQNPLLWGQALLPDVLSRETELSFHTALTHIQLRSVSCDFRAYSYAGEVFLNSCLFLAYAGSEYCPLGTGDPPEPLSWLNSGALDSAAVLRLPQVEMVLQEGCGEIGPQRIYPEKDFFCYPGSKTCLVLEGSIGPDLCYYPVPLPDMLPGQSYRLDLTLLRKGVPYPDMPVESGTVAVDIYTVPWVLCAPQTVFL